MAQREVDITESLVIEIDQYAESTTFMNHTIKRKADRTAKTKAQGRFR